MLPSKHLSQDTVIRQFGDLLLELFGLDEIGYGLKELPILAGMWFTVCFKMETTLVRHDTEECFSAENVCSFDLEKV